MHPYTERDATLARTNRLPGAHESRKQSLSRGRPEGKGTAPDGLCQKPAPRTIVRPWTVSVESTVPTWGALGLSHEDVVLILTQLATQVHAPGSVGA